MIEALKNIFGTSKPVITMAHLPALPGTPRYDEKAGVEALVDWVRRDVEKLLDAGVDGILFCNEDDRPYTFQVGYEAVAAMTRVVSECRPTSIPFGVDLMWDPRAAMAVAAATGAAFIREVVTGTYESDMGLWSPDAADLLRYRRSLNADAVKVFMNITPEFASPLGSRSVAARAHSAVVSSLADAILIAGPMAGAEPDFEWVVEAKRAVGDSAPVFLNTGARQDNIAKYLEVADGVIVGSALKVDGYTWNPVDPERLSAFMNVVNKIRVS
ncbi:MAG: BtpA/SgcQ family protein [Anaerolineales bacterium]|nr:MAG: BtpA/SgcQ family protein [Anaerolineales bacterium]